MAIENNMFAGTRTTSLAHGYVVINDWTIIILRIAHTMISAKVRPLSMLTCLYIIIYNTYTYIVLYVSGVYTSFECGCLEYTGKTRGGREGVVERNT